MMNFQGISVRVEYPMMETQDCGSTMAYTEFKVHAKPEAIRVYIKADDPFVNAFTIYQTKAEKLEGEYLLEVPVTYNGNVPFTRQKGKDNVDVILLRDDCYLKDLQVSVTSRKGSFYLNVQKIWSGALAVSEEQDAGVAICEFVPDEAVFNYPGANYANIWRGMAEEILRVAKDLELKLPKASELRRPRWEAARLAPQKDWYDGTVNYYNMVTGTGQIYRRGETFFVHFSSIQNSGPQGLLNPGAGVYFRTQVVQQKLQIKSAKAA